MTRIAGAGGSMGGKGGGGSQHTPTTAPDSLFSTSYAKLVDLISEGEIYGLKDGLKSIYVDNTPLQNADGSYNFQNVSVYTRTGTQSQTYIPGFDDIANEVSVGVTVQQALPVVRTIVNPAINATRLTISVPSLQQIQSNGAFFKGANGLCHGNMHQKRIVQFSNNRFLIFKFKKLRSRNASGLQTWRRPLGGKRRSGRPSPRRACRAMCRARRSG